MHIQLDPRKIFKSEYFAAFVAVLFGYGIFIPWFSLYGDDWIYLYAYHLQGPGFYADFVALDRPFSAWVYMLASAILGKNAWLYHILLLVLRWLSCILLFKILLQIWPQHRTKVLWTSLLFVIYPGFLQQAIPIQFILHFSVLNLLLVSFLGMIYAVRYQRWFWPLTGVSILGAAGVFSIEYFFGLEFLRPVILWMILKGDEKISRKLLVRILIYWLPYLILAGVFLVWRVFIYQFKHYSAVMVERIIESPFQALPNLFLRMAEDFRLVTFGAWRQILKLPESLGDTWMYVGLLGITFLFFYAFSRMNSNGQASFGDQSRKNPWFVQAFVLGFFSILVGGIPIWAVNLPMDLRFPWDRSTLPFMIGSALIIVAVINGLIKERFQGAIFSLILALAIGFHFQNALVYRAEANVLRDYFWQLTWRVPGLQQNTLVLSDQIPLFRFSDNGLTPILNWTYVPTLHSRTTPYKLFELSGRLRDGMPLLEEGLQIDHAYRDIQFSGNTKDSLVIYYAPPACLRVLDDEDELLPDLPGNIYRALPLSNLSLIETDPAISARPPGILGPEPEKNWCYLFQKADLARQRQDWQIILDLWQEAENNGFSPGDLSELVPFIEANIQLGKYDQARDLNRQAIRKETLTRALCKIWTNAGDQNRLTEIDSSTIMSMIQEMGCN